VYAICSAHPSVIDKQDWAGLHGLPHGCIDACIVPPTLLSQYLPSQYEAVWSGRLPARSEDLIREHIRVVLRLYATACGA
jgi:tagatose-1,6-bisphosphate aldolase non-catalytic subunit AgaZ/GatZ